MSTYKGPGLLRPGPPALAPVVVDVFSETAQSYSLMPNLRQVLRLWWWCQTILAAHSR
jgi:hypothetical protein